MVQQSSKSGLPSYHSVINEGYDADDRAAGSSSMPQSPVAPLVVIWKERRVVIRRQSDYATVIAAIRRARTMETLGSRLFYLTAVIPGCGDELCEVSEDMWADLVPSLQSVNVVLESHHSDIPPEPSRTPLTPISPPPTLRRDCTSTLPTPPLSPDTDNISDLPRNIGPYVILKPLTGQHKTLTISSRDITVRELKALIHTSQGIPVDHQRLMHDGKQLEDRQTLRTASVPLGSTIDVRRVGPRGATQQR
ncbi:hypothetical protein BC629DRAFT_41263 [Irpex lacteus]|nr:hypothetical protein BC629DRAFT_41263 [Irpex lacteus]